MTDKKVSASRQPCDLKAVITWKTLARIAQTDNGMQDDLICISGVMIAHMNVKNTNNISENKKKLKKLKGGR